MQSVLAVSFTLSFCFVASLRPAEAGDTSRLVRRHDNDYPGDWLVDTVGQSVNQAVSVALNPFVSGFEPDDENAEEGQPSALQQTSEYTDAEASATALEKKCVPDGMRVAKVNTGDGSFNMVVLGDDDIVSKTIAQYGSWEVHSPEDMAAKANTQLPDSGLTLLDIGANVGYYSLLFASRNHKVIAVEPMTRNRKALEGSLCLNPKFQALIQVVPAALVDPSEAANTTCIIRSTNAVINIGNGALKCGAEVQACQQGDSNCEQVPVKTLDSLLEEISRKDDSRVDVVKMDVEGFECRVLKGGRSLFEKYHPRLLQVETDWFDAASCVNSTAAEYSYKLVKEGANTAMLGGNTKMMSFVQLDAHQE